MRLFMIALLAVPQATDREESSGFTYTVPKNWIKRVDPATKATHFQPLIVPQGQECQLVLYPTSENPTVTPQILHDNIYGLITQGSKVLEEPKTGTAGLFKSSQTKMTLPNGQTGWTMVFTAKARDTIGGAAFIATSEALFKAHSAAVVQLIQEMNFAGMAPAGPAQAIHGLVIPLPPGWGRKDNPSGAVEITRPPPAITEARWDYRLFVMPSVPLTGTLWETQRAVFDEILKVTKLKDLVPPIHKHEMPGPFIHSASAGKDAQGNTMSISMYGALSDGKLEYLLIHGQEDMKTLHEILAKTTVKNPPPAKARPKIVEAYRRANRRTSINTDGSTSLGSLQYERIWLRSDGVADFTTTYPEGYAAHPHVHKADPALQNGWMGGWKNDGNKVLITRSGGKTGVYERENGKLRFGDQVWQPMPSVDGLKLEGRWGTKAVPNDPVALPPIWIEFTKDGRFKDEGVLNHVSFVDDKGFKPPKKSSGTYEIREFTMFIKFDDGTTWSTDFSTMGEDIKDLSFLLFKTWGFQKL